MICRVEGSLPLRLLLDRSLDVVSCTVSHGLLQISASHDGQYEGKAQKIRQKSLQYVPELLGASVQRGICTNAETSVTAITAKHEFHYAEEGQGKGKLLAVVLGKFGSLEKVRHR